MDEVDLREKSKVKVRQLVTDAGLNAQMRLFNSIGADATRDRLMSDWTTQGVVGALVLSMTYGYAVDNPLGETDPPWLATAFTYFSVITTTSAANAVLISMYFAVQMNLLPGGDDARYYIERFGKFMGLPNLLMTISFIGMFLALTFALVAQDRVSRLGRKCRCMLHLLTFMCEATSWRSQPPPPGCGALSYSSARRRHQ